MRVHRGVPFGASLRLAPLHRRCHPTDEHLAPSRTHGTALTHTRRHVRTPAAAAAASPLLHLFESPTTLGALHCSLPENVVSGYGVTWAEETVRALEQPHNKPHSFFDLTTSTCVLCGSFLHGGFRFHQTTKNHTARRAIVVRALAYLHTFCSQATHTSGSHHHHYHAHPSRHGRFADGADASSGSSRTRSRRVKDSCYYTAYTRSPLFEEDGVPCAEVLFHNREALHKLDLVDILLKRWWRTLHQVPAAKGGYAFDRIPSLSSANPHTRVNRLRYLLFFLTSRGILRRAVRLTSNASSGNDPLGGGTLRICGGEAFEQLELLGDCIFKNFCDDRLHVIFPEDEGGVPMGMEELKRVLDCNHGLLTIYDYLHLEDLTQQQLNNNKSKADIVEALVGELQALVWATELTCSTETYSMPAERVTTRYLHAVLQHTLNELAHVTHMWCIEATLCNAKTILKECLDKKFAMGEHGGRQLHGGGAGPAGLGEFERAALAERRVVLPLLLPWQQSHSGARSEKEKLAQSARRRPARPADAFPSTVQHLSPVSGMMTEELRGCLAVPRLSHSALTVKQVHQEVAQSVLHAPPPRGGLTRGRAREQMVVLAERDGGTTVEPVAAVPGLRQQPQRRASTNAALPPKEAVEELLRVTCVVVR